MELADIPERSHVICHSFFSLTGTTLFNAVVMDDKLQSDDTAVPRSSFASTIHMMLQQLQLLETEFFLLVESKEGTKLRSGN